MEAALTSPKNRGAVGAPHGVAVHSDPGAASPSGDGAAARAAHDGEGAPRPAGRSTVPGPAPVRTAAELPDRRYFRIGEVAVLLGVKPYVLRYWETEFPQVRPQKSRSGQRLYRRREVEVLLDIRHLLYERGFTIAGARKALKEVEDRGSGISTIPLSDLPSQLPTPASGLPVPSTNELSTVPPPINTPTDGPAAEIPTLTPQRAEQLTLALSQVDHALLEELRDGIRDLLSLCREG